MEPDFKPPQAGVDAAVEEQNLLYVACTRAIHRLEYNAAVSAYFARSYAENASGTERAEMAHVTINQQLDAEAVETEFEA